MRVLCFVLHLFCCSFRSEGNRHAQIKHYQFELALECSDLAVMCHRCGHDKRRVTHTTPHWRLTNSQMLRLPHAINANEYQADALASQLRLPSTSINHLDLSSEGVKITPPHCWRASNKRQGHVRTHHGKYRQHNASGMRTGCEADSKLESDAERRVGASLYT